MRLQCTLRRYEDYGTKVLCSILAAEIYKIIEYHYLHFPDEESVTFEKEVIKIIKNSNTFLAFSHRKHSFYCFTLVPVSTTTVYLMK